MTSRLNPVRFLIRDARDGERGAMRDVTLAAYEEYAAILPESVWAGVSAPAASDTRLGRAR